MNVQSSPNDNKNRQNSRQARLPQKRRALARLRPYRLPLILAGLLLGLGLLADRVHTHQVQAERQAQVEATLSQVGSQLTLAINERFALLAGLKAYTEAHDDSLETHQATQAFLDGLLAGKQGVRNFLIAPGGISRYETPPEESHSLLGSNLLQDERPQIRADIQRAVESGRVTISGPYELRQGGQALVARQAIYRGGQFWGLISMALDLPPLLAEAGLSQVEAGLGQVRQGGVELALRDGRGQILAGDARLFAERPLLQTVPLPEGAWELGGRPVVGWEAAAREELLTFRGVLLAVGALLMGISLLLVNQKERLTQAVEGRTRQLAESERDFRLLAENARDWVYRYRYLPQLGVDFMSPAVERLLGYSSQDFQRDPGLWFRAVHPEDRGKWRAATQGEHLPETPILLRWVSKDGATVWVEHHNRAVREEGGQLAALEGIGRDVSLRMRELESRGRYQALFEGSGDIILFVSREGQILDANQAALEAYDYSEAELRRLSIRQLRAVDPPETVAAQLAEADRAGVRFETVHVRRDGSTFPVEVRSSGVEVNGERVLMSIVRDIQERKQAEAEILRLNAELEQRVLARTAELQAANAGLEAFAYSVAHDLRTPLRTIAGYAQALLDRLEPQAEERAYLERIEAASLSMGHLIADLLRLSQVTEANLILEPVDLGQLAGEVAAELAQAEPERQVTVRVESGLWVQADRRLMRLALEQLLGNAWKFTRDQQAAVIEVGAAEGQPGAYQVRDNGVGFDAAYADKLFQPFQRLHSAQEYPGQGIGLAIVARVLARHGGAVWAESRPGQGAAFYFKPGTTTNERN